jgi:hypothetical protein
MATRPRSFRTRRSREIPGTGDDKGRWYRCQFCGSICKVGRESEGSGSGIHLTDSGETTLRGGETYTDYTVYTTEISGGCWFCGCKTWR